MENQHGAKPGNLIATPPPPAPRELNRRIGHRAWREPRVRSWWLAALVLLILLAYVAIQQTLNWWREADLVRNGQLVEAVMLDGGGTPGILGRRLPPDNPVILKFEYRGTAYEIHGFLTGRSEHVITGTKIPLRIDPNNPQRWTWRQEPTSLVGDLLGVLVLLPLVPLLLAVAVIRRVLLLRTYRNGAAAEAVVVKTHQSALAPLSTVVRCVLKDRQRARTISVYLPHRIADLSEGDSLWLIIPSANPSWALPAASYQ